MQFFVRAVVYGFALSLGQALFKKVEGRLGLGENKKPGESETVSDAAPDPKLQS